MAAQRKIAFVTLVVGLVLGAGLAASFVGSDTGNDGPEASVDQPPELDDSEAGIQQFGSEQAFEEYVQRGHQRTTTRGWWGTGLSAQRFDERAVVDEVQVDMAAGDGTADAAPAPADDGAQPESGGSDIERIAGSNVQVAGLDEPDIVKTDGERFYYSPRVGHVVYREPGPVAEDGVPVREPPEPESHVVDASEPAEPEDIASIDASGELLQTGDRLVVLEESESRIVAFDVSDPADPEKEWEQPLEDSLVTAREADGQLYVVTQTRTSVGMACPITPLGQDNAIECADVYAPETQTTADATYTAFSIDATSGEIDDTVSFVGTGSGTVVYMSENGLYITYTTGTSESELMAAYVEETDIVPEDVEQRVLEIQSYDISDRSKRTEIEMALERWFQSLPEEERHDKREQLYDGFREYLGDHRTELTQTSIVNVGVDDGELSVGESGTVPGTPLNQFALDEYEGTLRITTTIPRTGNAESINNLYVLDSETLDREGNVTGMGEDQRVYSVRYVGDRGYVVTFRQIDPFYVIDFEDPTDPEELGELKLPGFSSYMHPVDDDSVLGIGQENGRVKAALFDVSEPTDPEVGDDLVLDEWQSGIDDTHHAFLMDRRHEVFFLPAGNSGYVVDYADGDLSVATTVEASASVDRARYVNNYLYVFAGEEVIVLDQEEWERTETLDLSE